MVVSVRPEVQSWGTTAPGGDPFISLVTLRCQNRKRDGSGQMRHCGAPLGDADLSRPNVHRNQCGRCQAWNVVTVVEAR